MSNTVGYNSPYSVPSGYVTLYPLAEKQPAPLNDVWTQTHSASIPGASQGIQPEPPVFSPTAQKYQYILVPAETPGKPAELKKNWLSRCSLFLGPRLKHLSYAVFMLAVSVFKMGVVGMLSKAAWIGGELTYAIGVGKKNPVALLPGVVTYYLVRGALHTFRSLSHDLIRCVDELKRMIRP